MPTDQGGERVAWLRNRCSDSVALIRDEHVVSLWAATASVARRYLESHHLPVAWEDMGYRVPIDAIGKEVTEAQDACLRASCVIKVEEVQR